MRQENEIKVHMKKKKISKEVEESLMTNTSKFKICYKVTVIRDHGTAERLDT